MPTATAAEPRRYELWDPMPDEVRDGARRFATVQALNELVGVLPFAEWLDRAPGWTRRQMLTAKVQDEVGHGHVAARVAEDLGMPRERILLDYLEGRSKVHNIFHYSFASWEEFGPGLLLMNSAAILQFRSLMKGVYLPYARALRKIEREESFHYQHALDLTHEVLTHGDTEQRRRVQEGFETWLPRVLAYLGPPDTDTLHTNRMHQIGLKPDGNDQLRQAWLTKIVPVFRKLGVHVDPALARETSPGQWEFAMPDWAEVKKVIAGGGPASQRRLDWVRSALDRNTRYRHARAGDRLTPHTPTHTHTHTHTHTDASTSTSTRADADAGAHTGTRTATGTGTGTATGVYEVFAQTGTGSPLTHVGSLVAPRHDTAWHLAKETYGRRDDLSRLWVVRRTDLIVSSAADRDLLAAKTRMPHRQPGFPTARRRDRTTTTAPDTTAPQQRPPGHPGTGTAARDAAGPQQRPPGHPGTGAAGRDAAGRWLALADDLFVLGSRLGERIVDYIDLEESLAVGSIAQEALSHAETIASLHGFDEAAADTRFFERPQEQWQTSRAVGRIGTWPSTVVCGLVVAAAVTVLTEERAAHEPAVAAVRDEQLVHLDHWRRWARALAAWPETREEFTQAYAEVTRSAGDLFGAGPQDAAAGALHERMAALVTDSAGPGSQLPPRPVPRTAGAGGSALADFLARGRTVRDHYPAQVFL